MLINIIIWNFTSVKHKIFDCSDDVEHCLEDREAITADDASDDFDCNRRTDVTTPTPQSPRPPSTGNHFLFCSIIS